MLGIEDPGKLTDMMVVHVGLKLDDKQRLLEAGSPERRLEEICRLLQAEVEILQVEQKLDPSQKQMEKSQKNTT
jgi:ATP-dependent Lon protease